MPALHALQAHALPSERITQRTTLCFVPRQVPRLPAAWHIRGLRRMAAQTACRLGQCTLTQSCALSMPSVRVPRIERRRPPQAVVMELEARGAKVVPVFAGGLDFSVPVEKFFFNPLTKLSLVDSVVSLTGFALVGGPARQDHPRAVDALKRLNVPYMARPSLPLPSLFPASPAPPRLLSLPRSPLPRPHIGARAGRSQPRL